MLHRDVCSRGHWFALTSASSAILLIGGGLSLSTATPAFAIGDPVIAVASDVQVDSGLNIVNARATSDLALSMVPDQAWLAGDETDDATAAEYATYPQHWGRLGNRLTVVPGNHEILDGPSMPSYTSYFGAQGGPLPKVTDVGAWRVYFLDSNTSFAVGSPSYAFVQADLVAHPNQPIAAVWHTPLWSNTLDKWSAADPTRRPMWDLLYAAHADLIINGHSHGYQRWTQLSSSGVPDDSGIREFIVATGGKGGMAFASPDSRVQYEQNTSRGVMRLVLHPTSYEWRFVSTAGVVLDSGSVATHNSHPSALVFRGAARFVGNVISASVVVPPLVEPAELLLMFATVNVTSTAVTAPTGWTPLANFVTGSARTLVWSRATAVGDSGGRVSLRFGGYTKTVLQLVAYGGVTTNGPVAAVATRSETTATTSHTTPTMSVASQGQWVVSYWADKSSTTTDWKPPSGVSVRDEAVGSGLGRISALLVDSGMPIMAGTAGGLTATTDAASRAATISVLLT